MSTEQMVKLTTDQWQRLKVLFPKIKGGKAQDINAKIEMVAFHNDVFGSNYNPKSNCPRCLQTCYSAIKKIYFQNEEE